MSSQSSYSIPADAIDHVEEDEYELPQSMGATSYVPPLRQPSGSSPHGKPSVQFQMRKQRSMPNQLESPRMMRSTSLQSKSEYINYDVPQLATEHYVESLPLNRTSSGHAYRMEAGDDDYCVPQEMDLQDRKILDNKPLDGDGDYCVPQMTKRSEMDLQDRKILDNKPSLDPPSFDELERSWSRDLTIHLREPVYPMTCSVEEKPFFWPLDKKRVEQTLAGQSVGVWLVRKSSKASKYAVSGLCKKIGLRHYVFEEVFQGQQVVAVRAEINHIFREYDDIFKLIEAFNKYHGVGFTRPLSFGVGGTH